jgi:hypothetical protein
LHVCKTETAGTCKQQKIFAQIQYFEILLYKLWV